MLKFDDEVVGRWLFGVFGFLWEFNLCDIFCWGDLLIFDKVFLVDCKLDDYFDVII